MDSTKREVLGQYPTPAWAAAAIVGKHFSDLGAADVACDPTCGPGRFLQAIPDHVGAFGVEIDPEAAQVARQLTGRTVVVGDIRDAKFPERPTAFIGNPPFQMKLVDVLLDRAFDVLQEEGRVGLILPCYALQTAGRVVRYNERWSLSQEMIPRNIYPGLSKPLLFAMFRKEVRRLMVGFSLYHEAAFVLALPVEAQEAMNQGPKTWAGVVLEGFDHHGGEASLTELYAYVAERRPSKNPHWREQVRKICQHHSQRVGRGRYARTPQRTHHMNA
ncbi:DNA methylase [Achromobacter sp. 2789STDY5608633]|jgi:hypothetical protein|uniref:DNA methyltransferase n=1 Tax=Achromobacter sp. 2789STDY5608633 TaxID=1806501 RepID=UPI0006C464AF|nr:DNA methyltransferase [Achromobacter sp. 2789STDY5608633]CUJ68650.1 DNA methylase [Achromobacter sp. 2789STDY5608633]